MGPGTWTHMGIEDNKSRILAWENLFAHQVAGMVLEKPKLSVWMVLIPIITVFHIYRHQKYVEGKKAFADNFLVSRRRSLEEAAAALAEGRKPEATRAISGSSVPAEARRAYDDWITVLLEHYYDLLRSEGSSYDDLVRGVFRSHTDYLLFLSQLARVEHRFNSALRPSLSENHEAVEEIISHMEAASDAIRRKHAATVFS